MKVLSGMVMVRADKPQGKTVWMPPKRDKDNYPNTGTILMVGVNVTGFFPGERVAFARWAGTTRTFEDGMEATVMREDDIQAVLL